MKNTSNNWAIVLVALIGLVGVIITAVLARESGPLATKKMEIDATMTSETKQITPTLVQTTLASANTSGLPSETPVPTTPTLDKQPNMTATALVTSADTTVQPVATQTSVVISTNTPISLVTSKPPSIDDLVLHCKQVGCEYGWGGGDANPGTNTAPRYFSVLDIQVDGDRVTIKYDWKNGVLNGQLSGNTLKGTWNQNGDIGDFDLVFAPDFLSAGGKWDTRPPGKGDENRTQQRINSLRLAK